MGSVVDVGVNVGKGVYMMLAVAVGGMVRVGSRDVRVAVDMATTEGFGISVVDSIEAVEVHPIVKITRKVIFCKKRNNRIMFMIRTQNFYYQSDFLR